MAGGTNDLPKLIEDLSDEERERCEEATHRVAGMGCITACATCACRARLGHSSSFLPRRLNFDLTAQGRRDSNPQPPVLETDALPIEPLPFDAIVRGDIGACVSMVVDNYPVGEHTRGQQPKANSASPVTDPNRPQ
jgi:hypothetical protein